MIAGAVTKNLDQAQLDLDDESRGVDLRRKKSQTPHWEAATVVKIKVRLDKNALDKNES